MKNNFETITSNALFIRIAAIISICALLLAIPAAIQFFQKLAIVYPPLDACNLLTETNAKTILGTQKVINNRSAPTINTATNIGTSKCSYTDMNMDNMSVIAVAIQSGINDKGVQKIKDDFAASQKNNEVEEVDGVGEKAYYLSIKGQLNVRDDHHWYIFNHSSGDNPTNTTKQQAIDFAKKLLEKNKGTARTKSVLRTAA